MRKVRRSLRPCGFFGMKLHRPFSCIAAQMLNAWRTSSKTPGSPLTLMGMEPEEIVSSFHRQELCNVGKVRIDLFGGAAHPPYRDSWSLKTVLVHTCGDQACHPERSERSGSTGPEILRCAQDDSQ